MSYAGAVVTYVVSWWLFFFMALPFGVRADDAPVPGSERGAPGRPRLLPKVLAATTLAAVATFGVAWLIDSGLIQVRPSAPP
jgi:predicted secreted protein